MERYGRQSIKDKSTALSSYSQTQEEQNQFGSRNTSNKLYSFMQSYCKIPFKTLIEVNN